MSTASVAEKLSEEYQEIPLADLKSGMTLHYPVYHRGAVMLLAEGTIITPRVVELLQQRGVEKVRMHARDIAKALGDDEFAQYAAPIESPTQFYRQVEPPGDRNRGARQSLFRTISSRRLDDVIAERGELRRAAGSGRLYIRSRPIADLDSWRQWTKERDEQTEARAVESQLFLERAAQSRKLDADWLLRLFDEEVRLLIADPDRNGHFSKTPSYGPYPGRHAVLTSRLAMLIAAHMGWSREEVVAVGIGAFCHDVGMLRLPEKLYRHRGRLDSLAIVDVVKHPVYALDLVAEQERLPEAVRYVVYQIHERLNGTGYPRGRTTATIHPAARVAGLADTYVARISMRPHRNPLLPHQAILEVMQETHAGHWEAAATKSLLRAIGLYPLGSFVELSDGRLARVIAVNEQDQKRPTLEAWHDPASLAHEIGELVDLRSESRLTISRATQPPQVL